ncbi:MAG: hypothetical protein C0412_18590 [Flavobacterium sp.]|nr:hypothetical protein [Flavobacterium sp.]
MNKKNIFYLYLFFVVAFCNIGSLLSIGLVCYDQNSTFAFDANCTLTLTQWGEIPISGTFKKQDGTVIKIDNLAL